MRAITRYAGFLRRVVTQVVIAVAATSCGSDDVGTNSTPSVTLSINPTKAIVSPGTALAIHAELVGSGGFMGEGAAFAVTSAPLGITSAVSRIEAGPVTTATITTFVASTVAPGTYTLTLTGSGTGVSPVSASFELVVPIPSIALRVNPTRVTVAQGLSVSIEAALVGSGGFRGAGAAFTLSGGPTGITYNVSNVKTIDSITTATLTALAAPTVPLGTYALELTGSGSGVNAVTLPFEITVGALCFSLSVNPTALTVGTEEPKSATITIGRVNGFAGNVELSASGSSDRLWTLFAPASTTGNASIMTVGATGSPQSYILSITGASPGCGPHTVMIPVQVEYSLFE